MNLRIKIEPVTIGVDATDYLAQNPDILYRDGLCFCEEIQIFWHIVSCFTFRKIVLFCLKNSKVMLLYTFVSVYAGRNLRKY